MREVELTLTDVSSASQGSLYCKAFAGESTVRKIVKMNVVNIFQVTCLLMSVMLVEFLSGQLVV